MSHEPLPFSRPTLGEAEQAAVREVLESGWITSGPRVRDFEAALAEYLGGGTTVRAFNSCTSALEVTLAALGIGPGDEVIVPAMSFVATANVVLHAGALPVFVDVDLDTRNLDPEQVEAAVTPRTRALMPVHFAGLPAALEPLQDLAEARGLHLVEDAAQAIGAAHDGRRIGASGNPVCFSFHPNKNITTIEGGAVAYADPGLTARLEALRFHGIVRQADGRIDVPEWGGKYNLPDVGAAIGLAQLPRLEGLNARRRTLAERYLSQLAGHPVLCPPADAPGHAWHLFCVRIDFEALEVGRPEIQARLAEHGIGTGVHYPAIPLFSLYRRLGYAEGDFPNAECVAAQTLTLPLFPAMEQTDVDRVCAALKTVLERPEA